MNFFKKLQFNEDFFNKIFLVKIYEDPIVFFLFIVLLRQGLI